MDKGIFGSAKESSLIHHYATTSPLFKAIDDMLKEKHLRCPGLIGKVSLSILSLFAAEGRIG